MRAAVLFILFGYVYAAFAAFDLFSFPDENAAAEPVSLPLTSLELRNQRLFSRSDTRPFTGYVTESYPTGQLKSRSQVVRGRLEGLSEGWHVNGVLQVREHFRGGASHGRRTKFDQNGKALSEAYLVGGKLHGLYREWNPDGTLAEEIALATGANHGWSYAFFPSGSVKARALFEQGVLIERQTWQEGDYPLP